MAAGDARGARGPLVITREEADRLREQLLEVLAEDAHNTQRLLARLDSITRESGVEASSALLLILTNLPFDEEEARRHWEAILDHRHQLSLALARDVGVRVAAMDYFMHVNRRLVHPTVIELELFEAGERGSAHDVLTGLADEPSFRQTVQTELRRAKRYNLRVSVVAIDIDDFGAINERVGRLVGDRLLRETAMLLNNKIRDIDLAARPGEDELALVLPETDRGGAVLVAERFRREVEAHFGRREADGRPVGLTLSAGVACYPEDAVSPEELLTRAAQALYRAKAEGKNAVQAYSPERRRYLRFDLDPRRFEVEVLDPRTVNSATPRNLSRSGILFGCPEPLEVGEAIEIRLVDAEPGHRTPARRARGRVVRLEELPEPGDDVSDAEDRFEIGVAFDLDWAGGEEVLLDFLERAQARRVRSRT